MEGTRPVSITNLLKSQSIRHVHTCQHPLLSHKHWQTESEIGRVWGSLRKRIFERREGEKERRRGRVWVRGCCCSCSYLSLHVITTLSSPRRPVVWSISLLSSIVLLLVLPFTCVFFLQFLFPWKHNPTLTGLLAPVISCLDLHSAPANLPYRAGIFVCYNAIHPLIYINMFVYVFFHRKNKNTVVKNTWH